MILLISTPWVYAQAQTLAFPGAEGFGRFAKGGRGGMVIEVTNLNDSGSGSLRAAVEALGPRIVVFRVGGTITLASDLVISNPNITIAGQTAPGDGILIKNGEIAIKASEVIIRFVRSRPGFNTFNTDGFSIAGSNVILDHCSTSWSTDEGISIIGGRNITVQWCIAAEGLFGSSRESKGIFARGSNTRDISIHHNYMISNNNRNPLGKGESNSTPQVLDFVNNLVVYGTGRGTSQTTGGLINHNWVGNAYLADSLSNRKGSGCVRTVGTPYNLSSTIFLKGNICPTRPNNNLAEDLAIDASDSIPITQTRFSAPSLASETDAFQAYIDVLAKAGARMPVLDSVDQRLIGYAQGTAFLPDNIGEVITDYPPHPTGKPLIQHENDVGGYSIYNSGTAPVDTDRDGMPDAWETQNGLDPSDPSDGSKDADGDGYTNVEEYLNSLLTGSGQENSPPSSPTNLIVVR